MTGRRSSVVCRTVRMTFVASLRIRSVAESNDERRWSLG